ncbi:hypothetical protein [Priestia koreensis]|uniref:hypothetical protein n=1 Tax=Priestia koreensis TaxID=284581 RepID=UPI003019C793
MMKKTFRNQHRMLESFGYEFLVTCPSCNHYSKVISLGDPSPYVPRTSIRFVCTNCGMSKELKTKSNGYNQSIISYGSQWKDGVVNIGGPYDWYFGYSLYLQTPCCGHTLWVYNREHLTYLKRYVEAELRESHPYYLSVESRLPVWIKSSKNREAVLKAIEKLENKFA